MKEVLVSICCLTYNHEDYIDKCIQGFLMQKTNFSFEIIIYEDASTDNTAGKIAKYQKEYPGLFKVIRQEVNQFSQGIQPFFKFLFPQARGKYIAYCEGDDYWTDPLKLQKQFDFMETNENIKACGTNYNVLRGNKLIEINKYSKRELFDHYDIIFNNRIGTLTVMIRNNFQIPNYLEGSFFGDFSLLLFLTKNNEKIAVLPFNSAVFRVNETGIYSGATVDENIQRGFSDTLLFLKHDKKDIGFLFYSMISCFQKASVHFARAVLRRPYSNFRYSVTYIEQIRILVGVYLEKTK
ncbi:MAG: glycosyltransferase family 2 protein [Bacteroidota bacterium]